MFPRMNDKLSDNEADFGPTNCINIYYTDSNDEHVRRTEKNRTGPTTSYWCCAETNVNTSRLIHRTQWTTLFNLNRPLTRLQ